jgi:hypothetical protein
MVISLGYLLPSTSSGVPEGSAGRLNSLFSPCVGWGLPGHVVTNVPVRSYRTISPLPKLNSGGIFLLHFPSGRPARPLACTLPYEARTFLRGWQASPRDHPSRSGKLYHPQYFIVFYSILWYAFFLEAAMANVVPSAILQVL